MSVALPFFFFFARSEISGSETNTCVARSHFPFPIAIPCHMGVEQSVLTLFVLGFFSSAVDAPPVPCHGAPSAPRESVRVDILPICTRRAKLCLLYNPDHRTVSGQGAGIDLEILGLVGLSPQCRGECACADVLRTGCSMDRCCFPVLGISRSPRLRSRYMHRICHRTLGAIWVLRSGSWREERITRGTQG